MRDGWVKTTFGDVARVTSGFAFSTKSWRETGIPVIKINNVRNGHVSLANCSFVSDPLPDGASRFLLKKGDLLITLTGEIGAVGFVTQSQPMYLNQRVGRIDLHDNKNVLLDFLGLFLTLPEIRTEMWSHGKGNAQLNISPTSIHSLKINLPPLPEQKRIVDLISSVDSYVEALQQQLETAKRSRNAVLHELLTAGGDDWVETTLGEVADVIDPHPSHRAPAVDDNGIPFIGIGDLRKTGDIDFAKARRVSRDILEEHKARYNRSEFLIGLGRVASIGMVVRLPDENTEYVVSPTLAVIKAKDLMGQFLFYLLEGPHSQEQFQRFKKGSTRESVGMQILRKIKVHVPPLSEQQRIIEIIKSIDDVLSTTSCALSESKKLRTGLLSDLLSGEHEIPASYDKVMGAA